MSKLRLYSYRTLPDGNVEVTFYVIGQEGVKVETMSDGDARAIFGESYDASF